MNVREALFQRLKCPDCPDSCFVCNRATNRAAPHIEKGFKAAYKRGRGDRARNVRSDPRKGVTAGIEEMMEDQEVV